MAARKKKGSSRRAARAVAVKQWRKSALDLRVEGYTLTEIAKLLDKAVSTVHEAIEQEIAAIPAEAVARLRKVEGDRLDAIILGNLPLAKRGIAEASFACIAAINARAKLFGLNATEKVKVSGSVSLTHDAHAELLERLNKVVAASKVGTPTTP